MFETLAAYLDACVTPEQRKVCLDACNALVDAGVEDLQFMIEQELAVADSLDSDSVLGIAQGVLIPLYANVLSEFGVTLTEEANLAQYVDVFKALDQIDNYDDPETLQGYCDSPEGSQAALADILSVLGTAGSDEYLTILAYVSPSLLERISELTVRENVDELPKPAIVTEARERVVNYLKLPNVSAAATVFRQALEDGLRLGMSLDALIAPYRSQLDGMEPARLTIELLGFALASGNDSAFMRTILSREFEHHQLTADQILKVDVLIRQLLKDVPNA